jgi:hypothetical protein
MDKEQEEIRFALGALDDYRRLIAAGKTQRWDVIKWAVTINMALTAASIALRQESHGEEGEAFCCSCFGCLAGSGLGSRSEPAHDTHPQGQSQTGKILERTWYRRFRDRGK